MSTWFQSYGFAEVLENLLVGAYPLDRRDLDMLAWMGVTRILNLAEDTEYRAEDREAVVEALAATGIEEHRLSFTDFGGLPPAELETAVQTVCSWLDDDACTYLHCRAGWQRAATVATGVVAIRLGLDIDEGLDYVRVRKPSADPVPHQLDDLRRWWDSRARTVDE